MWKEEVSSSAALSCHMTMDLLCQEMRGACWDSSESLGSPLFTVYHRMTENPLWKCQSLKNLCAEQCVDLDGVRTIEMQLTP